VYQIRQRDQHFAYRNGWLDARWHFSFSHYHDPENVNFGPLRVFNDDVIDGESGFPLHPHRNMEIVTVLTDGKLSHYDTSGNAGQIVPGEVQKMSAGAGIQHSEWNYEREPVRLMQIWFMPKRDGLTPSYAQQAYSVTASGLVVVGSPAGEAGGVPIYQDVVMAIADTAGVVEHAIAPGRGAYVHVIEGAPVLDGEELARGDAARVTFDHERLRLEGTGRVLIIDLPVRERAERSTLGAGGVAVAEGAPVGVRS
jgi:redox-sensitive bicupin YhaK (pirin superfamily)